MGKQDVQGFTDSPNAVLARIGYVIDALGSSWEAPTQAEATLLQQAEQLLRSALARFNDVVGGDVATYRRRLEQAQVHIFPAPQPLTIDWTPSSGSMN